MRCAMRALASMHALHVMCYTLRMDRQSLATRRKKIGFALIVSGLLLTLSDFAALKAIGGVMFLSGLAIFIAGRLDQ